MLQVCFECYASYTTDSVYQWDLNRRLAIRGLDYDSAPAIHFSNKMSTEALVVQSTIEDGVIYCDVPNILLQEPYDIIGYVCSCVDQELTTYETIRIPVITRVKPADYAYSDNVEILTYYALMSEITSVKASTEKELENLDASKASKVELNTVKTDLETAHDTDINRVEDEIATERARIDQIVQLEEGTTTADAELMDIRVDIHGTTHESAGTAVRSQILELDSKIDDEVSTLSSEVEEFEHLLYKKVNVVKDITNNNSHNGSVVDNTTQTITIPIGSSGNTTYIGPRVMENIQQLRGKRVKCELFYTCNDDYVTSKLNCRVVSNNEGVTVIENTRLSDRIVAIIDVAKDSNATYIIFGLNNNNAVAVASEVVITLTNYTISIKEFDYPVNNHFAGDTMWTFGHSMTQMKKWQKTVCSELQLTAFVEQAVYGGTLVENYATVSNADRTCGLVTVWYDTNDWAQNKTLGTIGDTIDSGITFYSALKYVCEWLSTNMPKAKVLLISSPKRFDCEDLPKNEKGYPLNSKGNSLEDFANAIKDVAELYSYPFLSLFHTSGINKNNYLSYLAEDALHPNNDGGVMIGYLIANKFRTN